MARTGVYISDVKRARDALLAQGRHPSIDAVRAALGNTGSKSTIHKYLRELEAEGSTTGEPVSAAILALVNQLTEQLKCEAAADVDALRDQMARQSEAHDRERTALEARLAKAQEETESFSQRLASTERDGALLSGQLHAEQIARHKAEQHSQDLEARLADAQQHQASLEEKHKHARDALEHYRSAAKEQREQERRRHEQQVQGLQAELRQIQISVSVKQEELTRLNREAASLVSDLAAARQNLHAEKEVSLNIKRQVEGLQRVESRAAVLESQLAECRARATGFEEEATRAADEAVQSRQRNAVLEIELVNAKSALALDERLAQLDKAILEAALGSRAGTSPK